MKFLSEHTGVTISTTRRDTLPAPQQALTYPLPVSTPPKSLLFALSSPQTSYSYVELHVNGIT